jgi:hypothetical protein
MPRAEYLSTPPMRNRALENAKRLLPLRTAAFVPDIAQSAVSVVRRLVAPTFADVITAVPAERTSVLAALWCLLARGALYVDLLLPITPGSKIKQPELRAVARLCQVLRSDTKALIRANVNSWEIGRPVSTSHSRHGGRQ